MLIKKAEKLITKKLKKGRPTNYTLAIVNEICTAIASSSKGIGRLCKDNSGWPNQDTIFTWLKIHSDFSEQYARAKRLQIEVLVDEIIEIADDSSQDSIINKQGQIICNNAKINRARLRIDTRKWIASKLAPKIYGDKIDNTHSLDIVSHEEALKLLA
ncbi:MAG: hypothetical protein ABSA84_01315 [Gammaproteobacteria bacterium]